MEFGIETCAMLIMKEEKREATERIEQPNQERIRTLEEKVNNKHPVIFEGDIIKQKRDEKKVRKSKKE